MTNILKKSAALILLAAALPAAAGMLPLRIAFQSKLIDPATNNPKNGTFSMQFKIYNVPTGGSALFTETQSVAVNNGVFAVQLGTAALLSADLFSGASAYLGVTIGADSEMLPRQPLSMSPYAFTAMQLVNDQSIRINAGTTYSTFTAAGNLALQYGVAGTTANFTGTGGAIYSITASSGIRMQNGTMKLDAASKGLDATGTGVTASTGTFLNYFEMAAVAAPSASAAGSLRLYYDSTKAQWLASASGRAFTPLGTMSTTLWNTNSVAGVANQGLNLPAALTEFNSGIQGSQMLIDCDNLPAQLALRYNLRNLTATALTIVISVRDVSNTANVLATVSQAVTATANVTYLGQGALASKPGWCTGTKTVAIYTSGGNGAADYIFPHIILVGEP